MRLSVTILLITLFTILTITSILTGPYTQLAPETLAECLTTGCPEALQGILSYRAYRTAAAILVGAGLAASGMTVQYALRNPLADPYLLGVSAGAALGVIGVYAFTPSPSPALIYGAALAAGTLAFAVVLGVGYRIGSSPTALIVAGVSVSYAITGATIILMIRLADRLPYAFTWLFGTVAYPVRTHLAATAGITLAGIIILALLAPRLYTLVLGDEVSTSMGVDVKRETPPNRRPRRRSRHRRQPRSPRRPRRLHRPRSPVDGPNDIREQVPDSPNPLPTPRGLPSHSIGPARPDSRPARRSPPNSAHRPIRRPPPLLPLQEDRVVTMGTCRVRVGKLRVMAGGRTILDVSNLQYGPGLNGVIGPNGAGKTTLLRVLAGIQEAEGSPAEPCPPGESAYVPPTPEVDVLARVEDVLRAGLYGATRPSLDEAVRTLAYYGLEDLLDRRFSTLSSGEQRLVCIARALGRRPRLLLLDEPLSFLDIRNQVATLDLLEFYARRNDATVIMTTHNLEYTWRFGTLTLLSQGRPLYHGPADGVNTEILSRAYGVPLIRVEVEGLGAVFLPAPQSAERSSSA